MDEHVTTGQAITLLSLSRFSLAISTMPALNLPPYNQDLWFMVLLSIVYTIIMMQPLLFLSNRFNNFNLTGYLRIIYGKKLGALITVLYGLYFIMGSVDGFTILTEIMTSSVLVQEMNINIIIFMVLVTFYFISKGVVSIARAFQLLAPVSVFIIVSLMLLGLNNVDFSNIKPILKDSSFLEINKGAALLPLFFSDIFLLLMIVPDLKDKKSINKISVISVLISIICLSIIIILVQGAIGIQQTKHSNVSFLLYVRLIDAFDLFERIDSVFVASWLIASIGRNAGFLYISTRAFRELFNKKEDDKIILTITCLASGIISYLIVNQRSVIGIRKYFDIFYRYLFVAFVIIIPIITCIVYFFRRKTLEKIEPSQKLVDRLE